MVLKVLRTTRTEELFRFGEGVKKESKGRRRQFIPRNRQLGEGEERLRLGEGRMEERLNRRALAEDTNAGMCGGGGGVPELTKFRHRPICLGEKEGRSS